MKERLLKLVFVSLGLIFFVGCEKGPDDDEIFEFDNREDALLKAKETYIKIKDKI